MSAMAEALGVRFEELYMGRPLPGQAPRRAKKSFHGIVDEHRRTAVARSYEIGVPAVAAEMGVSDQSIYNWRNAFANEVRR